MISRRLEGKVAVEGRRASVEIRPRREGRDDLLDYTLSASGVALPELHEKGYLSQRSGRNALVVILETNHLHGYDLVGAELWSEL